MINKIKSKLQQVDYILHIADVHIRNWKRHKEYKEVFKKLYKAVDELPPNSIVTVGGDIAHAKTDMSPELVQLISELFEELAKRVPTIVICGNHDTNLNNNNRLDALTPIVDASTNPNLFYLRNTGLYEIGDIGISVMSLLDKEDEYITMDKFPEGKNYKYSVAMYHGTVANSKVDSGLNLSHGLDWDKFAGFDLVLLGDIHKRQVLCKEDPYMFYPGSLVQQNFGESFEGHGYAIVDLTKPKEIKCEYFDIPNEYGYLTVEVKDGILPDKLPITAKTSVRLKTINTTSADLKKILAEIRKKYKNSEVVVTNLDKNASDNTIDLGDSINGLDVRNVEYQNSLLKDYLQQFNVDDEIFNRIVEINKSLNSTIPPSELARNVVWKPKRFEFSNMFSYGEDNVIDFEKLDGIAGLFAPNHSGKSAILDALCFCLFDHSFRASKAEQVLNNKKDGFECKFQFQLNGLDYFIEKKATRYAKGPLAGRLRVDINFWYINAEGEVVSLNGEQRRDTDKIIQSYVGGFDDFILTALSLQGNNSNFIEKTQSERKDLLANFLDLKVFDYLADLASKENRTATVLLEEYQKQDFDQALGDAEHNKEIYSAQYEEAQQQINTLNTEVDSLNLQVESLAAELRPNEAQNLDLASLQGKKANLEADIEKKETALTQAKEHYDQELQELNALQFDLSLSNASTIESDHIEYVKKQKEAGDAQYTLDRLKALISTKLDKLQKLQQHEYDPNCKYCCDNVFVKDAINTREELEQDKLVVADLIAKKKELDSYLTTNNGVLEMWNNYYNLKSEHSKLSNKIKLADSSLQAAESQLMLYKNNLETVENNIKLFHKHEETIAYNQTIQQQIDTLKTQINAKKQELSGLNKQAQDCHGKVKIAEKTIEECNSNIDHMRDLLDRQVAYDYYTKAVGRDGIPYILISKAIPYIQTYVNNILSQVVDFTVEIETDGKNINVYIVYSDNKWPLELASGMERFMSSLAIRVALIKITNLPKPDFIAIDEGLGVLDSSNLNSMHMFFNYLKDIFRFSLIISHIDVVRDMVDNIITIDKREDFSYINHQ